MNFEEEVLSTIDEYEMIPGGTCVLVGVSGGADSVCLLSLLTQLRQAGRLSCALRAVHVHHGLRESAERDLRFVQDLCENLGIPLSVHRVDAAGEARRRGMSTEEAGRMLRRETFEAECAAWRRESAAGCAAPPQMLRNVYAGENGLEPGQALSRMEAGMSCRVALAHHMEDSAETMLFNLCRGSSLAGLGGIRPVTAAEDMPDAEAVIRPLIRASRSQIETWLREHGISWCSDETNADASYARNYLRIEILPRLREHVNEASAEHLARTAQELAETEDYLRQETERMLRECRLETGAEEKLEGSGTVSFLSGPSRLGADTSSGIGTPCTYSVRRLAGLPSLCLRRVLYLALVRAMGTWGYTRKDVTSGHVEALLRLLETEGSAGIDLPGGLTARKEYDRLTFAYAARASEGAGSAGDQTADHDGKLQGKTGAEGLPRHGGTYSFRIMPRHEDMEIPRGPYTKWVDYDKITGPVMFRTRQEGDIIAIGSKESGGFRYKKLSRVMIDRKVPEAEREKIVLPMDGNHVIWYPGYRIGAEYLVGPHTGTVLEIRKDREDDGMIR